MSKLVVIVHTEYHLLSCLSILSENYRNYSEIEILICLPSNSNRFSFDYPTILESTITITRIEIHSESTDYCCNLKLIEEKLFQSRIPVIEVLFFNRLSFFSQYLIRKCADARILVSLGPDGAAAYVSVKRLSPRWTLTQFLKYNKFLFNNKRFNFSWYFPTLDYANQPHIKRLYAQFPELIVDKYNREMIKYELLANNQSIQWSNLFFSFDIEKYISKTNGIFLFCNQPLGSLNKWNEILLNYVIENFPNLKIVVKAHPSTPVRQKEYFASKKEILFFDNTIPIELFSANCTNSIIASFWSTASLYHSKANVSIWLYPLLEKEGEMYKYITFPHKVEHIIYVDSLSSLNAISSSLNE